jgi:hypothetical protein
MRAMTHLGKTFGVRTAAVKFFLSVTRVIAPTVDGPPQCTTSDPIPTTNLILFFLILTTNTLFLPY